MSDYYYNVFHGHLTDGEYKGPVDGRVGMQWTSELPTQEGLYWVSWRKNDNWREPRHIEIKQGFPTENDFYYDGPTFGEEMESHPLKYLNCLAMWLGPIPVPELPV